MKKLLSVALCLALAFGVLCTPAYAASADAKLLSTPYAVRAVQMDVAGLGGVNLYFKVDNLPSNDDIEGNTPSYWLDFEQKINDGPWEEAFYNPTETFELQDTNEYLCTFTWGDDITRTDVISYRVRTMIYDTSVVSAFSPWSNVATVGLKASTWAQPEIEKALAYGIVPDSISDDYTKNITREEFAELAVRLYEVKTGTKSTAAPDSTFSDCSNPEVLKAFSLKIVNGVGGGKFDPKALTTREQIAAMLYRAVEAIAPTTDFSTSGATTFSDSSEVSSYFVENVKFMSLYKFITGSDGKFDPKGTCTREMAVLIAVRVYEAY